MKFFNKIPQYRNKNILLSYILTVLTNAWFIEANWIFFLLRIMTFKQIGIYDASLFIFGLLFGIPSGILADILGRKKVMLLSMFFCFIGSFGISLSDNITKLILFSLLLNLGWSFFPQTQSAFVFDSLKVRKNEGEYDKVNSFSYIISIVSYSISVFLGGILYSIHYRLPYFCFSFSYFVGIIASALLKEIPIGNKKFTMSNYFSILHKSIKHIFSSSLTRYLAILFVTLSLSFYYNYSTFKSLLGIHFKFYEKEMSYILSILGITDIIGIMVLPNLRRKINNKTTIIILAFITSISIIIGSYKIGSWGLIIFLFLNASTILSMLLSEIIINNNTPSIIRATTLSSINFFTKIPYMALTYLAGLYANSESFEIFVKNLGVISLILSVTGSVILLKKQKKQVIYPKEHIK